MSAPIPTTQRLEETKARANNFNFLRLALAVVVIFSHSTSLLLGIDHLDPVASLLNNQFDQIGDHAIDAGHLAVYGFFVMSGYLISMSFVRSQNIGSYLKKRVLRIYPGFLAAYLLCAVLFGPLGTSNPRMYWDGLLHHIGGAVASALSLSASFTAPPFTNTLETVPLPHVIAGSFWTIRYEFLCYLMVAALGMMAPAVFRRLPAARMAAPIAFFLMIYALYVASLHGDILGRAALPNHHPLPTWLLDGASKIPRLFVYFVAGMCLYAYRRWVPYNLPLLIVSLAALIVSALLPPLLPITFPIFGSYVILSVAFAPWLRLSRVGTKHDLSYGIYLYAFPIQQLLVYYLGSHLSATTEFLAALPLTAFFAWLSWTLVEHPAMKFKGTRRSAPPTELLRQANMNAGEPADGNRPDVSYRAN